MKRLLSSVLVAIMVLSVMPLGVMAGETSDINVYYNGEQIQFTHKPVVEDGVLMVEMAAFFDKIGAVYDYNAYKGTIDGWFEEERDDFHAILGEDIFTVKRVKLELPKPFYALGNTAMLPLETFCYAFNFELDCTNLSNVQVNYTPVVDAYNREEEVKSYLAQIDDCKTYAVNGEMADAIKMPQVVRSKPETWNEKIVDISLDSTVPFDTAYDSEVTTVTETHYAAQITWTFRNGEFPIKKGDVMVVSLWAKSLWANVETGVARLNVELEQLVTWKKTITEITNLSGEWKQYFFYGIAPTDMTDWQIGLRHHFCKQEIQIAGLEVLKYSDFPEEFMIPDARPEYDGIEDDALWRREALKRIEQYRKNNLTVNVVDENGKPIEGAKVDAEMFRHEFQWGINITHYEIGPDNFVSETGYANWADNFQEVILGMGFNLVTEGNAFKPEFINPIWVQDSHNWMIEHDMDIRQHLLFWEMNGTERSMLPEYRDANWSMDEVPVDVLRERIETQVNRVATFGTKAGSVRVDVVNELLTHKESVMRDMGFDEVVRIFDIVRQVMPGVELCITETNTGNRDPQTDATIRFAYFLKWLRELGCDFDVVGLQGHVGDANNPQHIIETMDMIGQYTDKLEITEYDMGTQRENEKAPYLRDSIIAAYSHPKCIGFLVWQPVEGGNPDRGVFLDMDGTVRHPDYDYWMQYVMGEWLTHETFETDADGSGTIRGHRGRYNVTVKVGNKEETITIDLTKDEDANVVNAVVTDEGIELTSPNKYVKKVVPYVNWNDWGPLTEVNVPTVKRYLYPETEIVGCENSMGVSLSHLLDELPETFWRSSASDNYAVVELKESVPLNQLKIHWHGLSVKKHKRKIEVSEDGETWKTVSTGLNVGVNEVVDLSGYTAKYIKVSGDNSSIAIDDLEVFAKR